MPNLRQPSRLEEMALARVADWVANIGEDLMTATASLSKSNTSQASTAVTVRVIRLKQMLQYNIPWMLFDDFAKQVFRSLSELLEKTKKSMGFRGSMAKFISKMNVAISLTEVLLNKNITHLNLDQVPKMMRHTFYMNISSLKGLLLLNLGSLSGGWKTSDMEPTIIAGLKALSNLRSLTINYDCTDNILESICDNCPHLQILDVTSSKNITNTSIDYLIRYSELRQVQLYRTGVTLEGFTKLLLYCLKLEDLGHCDEIGRVLEYIDITNSEAGPFALRKFSSRYATSNHLQLLVQLCPMIHSVSIFHNTLLCDLTMIIGLAELSELKLLSCDFFGDQVKQVLELKGCNIVNLHLEHVDQLDMNALMYISQFCPTLKCLTLYNCVLVDHTSVYTRRLNWLPFQSLERLMCVCEATEEQLHFLLSNCVNIRFIHLGTACQPTDKLFEKVMNQNPFLFLEELRIIESDSLTMATVSRLLSGCGNLRTLTELDCWSGLANSDKEFILSYIKINNLNLDISSRSFFAEE